MGGEGERGRGGDIWRKRDIQLLVLLVVFAFIVDHISKSKSESLPPFSLSYFTDNTGVLNMYIV